jgi:branched-chain amino acid transport system substrate-binding protein
LARIQCTAALVSRPPEKAMPTRSPALAAPAVLRAQAAPVRIGYAIARTGPWTGGAQVSQEPNYILWAEQLNAGGGLNVKGTKRPVELIASDDRSEIETVVRSYEKLMGSDKVDLILPPWGSNANFAVAPLANRHGYPFIAPTALSKKLIELKLPYFFLMLQQPQPMMNALVELLKANGAKTAAVIYVDDLFGLENYAALKVAVGGSGISLVEEKSYPLGVKDLSPVLRGIKDKNPDVFIALSYPPDTILASKQSKEVGFNPKFFYASVGTAYPLYRQVMGAGAEGVLGMGSWNRKSSQAAEAYFDAHTKKFNKEPDRWASGAPGPAWRSCKRRWPRRGWTARRSATTSPTTRTTPWSARSSSRAARTSPRRASVSQWQKGEFEVVWPKSIATGSLMPKPAWV